MNLAAQPQQTISSTPCGLNSNAVDYSTTDSTYSLGPPPPLTAPHSTDHSPEHLSAPLAQAHQRQLQQHQQLPSPSPLSPTFPPNSRYPFETDSTETLDLDVGPSQPAGSARQQSRIGGGAAQGGRSAPSIVAFDPDNAGSADDDDDDEDDSGSSKKKRKTRTGAARSKKTSAAPGGTANAAGDAGENAAGGSGSGKEDLEPRRKIEIGYIEKKEKRHITFSKRKAGIMKKAYELATLTGTEVLLLVVSETGIVYTFTTTKFQPLVGANPDGSPSEGQRLIQQCLAVDPDDAESSNYISPPPDGPLLPLPPSARKRPFEANSSAHGGQIALRTRQQRPKNKARPPPIGVPPPNALSAAGQSLPTPGIHATLDQVADNNSGPSGSMPHSAHSLRGLPIPPPPPPRGGLSGPGTSYPPSPSYPPGHPHGHQSSELPSPLHPSQEYAEMMDRTHLGGHYGPMPQQQQLDYPPPPALGYGSHQLPPPPLHHRHSGHALDAYSTQLQPQSRMHGGGYHSSHQLPQHQQQHNPYSHPQYASHYAAHHEQAAGPGGSPTQHTLSGQHLSSMPSPSSNLRGGQGGYFEGGGPPQPPLLRRSAGSANGQPSMYGGAGAPPPSQQQQQQPLPSPSMHPRGSVDEDMHMLSPLQHHHHHQQHQAEQHHQHQLQQQQQHRERIERRHSLATSTAGMMYDTGPDGGVGRMGSALGGGAPPPPPLPSQQPLLPAQTPVSSSAAASVRQAGGGDDTYMQR
ncbi:hypothetical protein JCM3774_004777 [Rhodotorula dairenensis]